MGKTQTLIGKYKFQCVDSNKKDEMRRGSNEDSE